MRACAPASSPPRWATRRPRFASTATSPRKLAEAGEARRGARAAAAGLRPRQVGRGHPQPAVQRLSRTRIPTRRASVAKGVGRAQADRRGLREGRRDRRGARCARRRSPRAIHPTSRCAPDSRWRMSARGDLDKARTYLSAETAGSNPALWLTLAEMELRGEPLARRQGGGRPGAVARSQPGAGGRRARLPARRSESRSRLSADRRGRRCRARGRRFRRRRGRAARVHDARALAPRRA